MRIAYAGADGDVGDPPGTPLSPSVETVSPGTDAYGRTKVQGGAPAGVGLRDFISAKDAPWNAAFDGTTDDSTALNNAQQTGSSLWLPNGTGKIAATVNFKKSSQRIRGQGMHQTVIKADAGLAGFMFSELGGGSFVSDVVLEDMTLDGSSVATQAIHAHGFGIGQLTLRRCRFIGFPGGVIDTGYLNSITVEDCEVYAGGAGLDQCQFFTATNKDLEVVKLRRNKIRYVHDGFNLGASGHHAAYVEIVDNDIDLGWWLAKSIFSGSTGTTYTATGLADAGAAFSGITTPQNVRAMPVRQTGTKTGGAGTYLVDAAATFVSNGVKRGDIVRSGTKWGPASKVISETAIHVEEWLDQTTYLPVAPPVVGASYTVYGVLIANITAFTGTTLTVTHSAGGAGGGWHDLTGAAVTPATSTLYEVIRPRPNYAVYVDYVCEKLVVCRNQIRRSWSDGLELFGGRMVVSDNIVEDGQDEGIFLRGVSTGSPSAPSVIGPNYLRHNGTSGLAMSACANIEIGPQQLEDNGWNTTDAAIAQLSIQDSVKVGVHGGRASVTAESAHSPNGLALAGTPSGCKIIGFSGAGHSAADIWVRSTVAAGANQILDCDGVLVYEGATNGQFTRSKGAGAPTFPASPGSEHKRTDGGQGTTDYVKEGANDNTLWNAVPTAAGLSGDDTHLVLSVQSAVANTNWPVPANPIISGAYFDFYRYTNGTSQNNSIEWDVIFDGGTYTFDLFHTKDTNKGIYTVQIDGVSIGTIDGYNASQVLANLNSITGVAITAGRHRVKLLMATKNGASSAYGGAISAFGFTRTGA